MTTHYNYLIVFSFFIVIAMGMATVYY